ncbi:hypothetical protein OROMI_003454 [Orobanche minor]
MLFSPARNFDPRLKVPGFLNLLKRLGGYEVIDNDFRATPSPDFSRSSLAWVTNHSPISEPQVAALVPPLLFGGNGDSPSMVDDVNSMGSVDKMNFPPLEENLTPKEGLFGGLEPEDPLAPDSDHIYFGNFKKI